VAVAAEKNSTLVLPFPVELLRFLERAAPTPQQTVQQSVQEQRPPLESRPDPDLKGSNSGQD
jgi:hypothetical protein